MTADTITVERLDGIIALLTTSVESMRLLRIDIQQGWIDPAEAAAIVNETIQNLVNEAR